MSERDLILHPVRMRILWAFADPSGSRRLTVRELAQELPDVAQTTLYRQVGILHRGGVLAVATSRRIRGAVERTYVLTATHNAGSPDDGQAASDWERRFEGFMASLVAQFAATGAPHFAEGGDVSDSGFRSVVFQASQEEVTEMVRALNAAVGPLVLRRDGEGLPRRLLATILLPLDAPATEDADV